jgi:(R,R)-butanediol dehydrogenase / meso-butanediol dehydrogenase / diacetyl reductase
MSLLVLKETPASPGSSFDIPGIAALAGALFTLIFGLIKGPDYGWGSARTVAFLGAAALLGLLFVLRESRARQPLLPLKLFRSASVSAGVVLVILLMFALFGAMFFMTFYLENVHGLDPIQAGVHLLPMTAMLIVGSPVERHHHLVDRARRGGPHGFHPDGRHAAGPGRGDGSHPARAGGGAQAGTGRTLRPQPWPCRSRSEAGGLACCRDRCRGPAPSGIIGCGGTLGGMSEYLLIQNAVAGQSVAVFPNDLPFEVAALNEPMAVARHCVNRSQARTADKVAVFGAGPIGLGAVIWLKLRGVRQVAVADVIPGRLQTALAVGADAVIDSSREDVTARLAGLHGHSTNALGAARPDTDIYIDAAGAAAVVNTALRAAKWGARLVTVAVHKKPEPNDLGSMLRSEMTIIASQGYPTEIFEVTPEIAEHQQRFSRLISHRVPFSEANQAFQLALTPGAAEKVVVTFSA